MKLTEHTRTKIICTIGPKCNSEKALKELKMSGMDIARINMSHGLYDEVQLTVNNIVKIRGDDTLPLLAFDTRGPEIRVKIEKPVEIKEGERVVLSGLDGNGKIKINLDKLDKIKKGMDVLVDDGNLRMVVDRDGDEVVCVAANSYTVKPGKAMNIPDMKMDEGVPTEKDKNDIFLGLKNKVDYVFLSFISNAAEIRKVRDFIRDMNGHMPVLIAKIENKEAIRNINEIIKEADGIMVARGDLAVEIGMEHCFSAQKMITKKCLLMKKPFIMATQMLESMTEASTPTRAEVSDVGNAVLDNCDCVMLSGETATGRHPAHVVRTMKTIVKDAEFFKYGERKDKSRAMLIFMHHYSDHVVELKYSYKAPVVIISKDEHVLRQVGHHAGFFCFKMKSDEHYEQTIERVKKSYGIDEYEWIIVGDERDNIN